MTTTPRAIIEPKFAEAASTLQYPLTAADAVKTSIDKFTATNTTGANVTLTINLVAAGGSVQTYNALTKVIPANSSWPFPELVGQILEAGDAIYTLASAANAVSIRASGRQFT